MFSHQVMSDSLRPHGLQHTSFSVLCYLSEFAQIHVCWVSDAIQPSYLPSSPSPPALNLSQNQGLSSESVLHIRQPKYWSSSFSISPSNEYSGLISFTTDWFDLLAVQGTLKSSPTPQWKSINSLVSLLYGPTLPSINDHWKNHTFDYMDLCWKSDISVF